MFENAFKRIDQILHTDSGSATELDYVEQTSWILFLKYLDDLEETKKTEASLSGKKYNFILDKQYQWDTWAAPKTAEGKIDHQKALDGDDLKDFVNNKLFPYLRRFRSEDPDTVEYKIGEIFSELKNKISSGYKLREILNIADGMRFQRHEEKHEMSHLYEAKIKNMGNAGRNGGEYYTPRPLIKTIVEVVKPKIGDKIYDGACGSAGFLVEAYNYMTQQRSKLSSKQLEILEKDTFYGQEIKSLAYVIGIMNMILHGVESPNIKHGDTLAKNINDIQEKDRFEVVISNPPFGAGIGPEIQQNFPIKTNETASLFLQHFIKILKANGRAGIVIKNTFLSNEDNASISLRKHLLESCNLHTILDLPSGVFVGAGVKTVVLFFDKGTPTKRIWYYKLNLDRNLGKKNPLNETDLAEFLSLQTTKADSSNSWTVNASDIDPSMWDLSVKNPHENADVVLRSSTEILRQINQIEKDATRLWSSIEKGISEMQSVFKKSGKDWEEKPLKELCNDFKKDIVDGPFGSDLKRSDYLLSGVPVLKLQNVKDGHLQIKNIDYVSPEKAEALKRHAYKTGDIVMTKLGAPLGVSAIVSGIDNGIIVADLVRIRAQKINTKYLCYFLNSPKIRQFINSKQKGTTRPRVRLAIVRELPIKYPKNAEDQEMIVKKIDTLSFELQSLSDEYRRRMEFLNELQKSLLTPAFAAEIQLTKVVLPTNKEATSVTAAAPSPFFRSQVHAAIIEQVSKDGGWTTEVAIAKYDHLLQEVFGLPLAYNFETHKFGPFDAKIKRLIASGLGKNKWFTRRNGMIVYGTNVRGLIFRQSNLYKQALIYMRQLSALGVTKMDADRVELLATVCHSIKQTKSVDFATIRTFMSEWPTDNKRTKAEKFPEDQTRKCLDFITKNNLQTGLLATI